MDLKDFLGFCQRKSHPLRSGGLVVGELVVFGSVRCVGLIQCVVGPLRPARGAAPGRGSLGVADRLGAVMSGLTKVIAIGVGEPGEE